MSETKPILLIEKSTSTDGGARRDRTADLLHAMQALSQLSYSPEKTEGRFYGYKNSLSSHHNPMGAIESVVFLSYPGNWRQKIDLSSYGNKKTIQIISYIRY